MTTEDCMTIIGTHHITEDNFWGKVKGAVEKQIPSSVTYRSGGKIRHRCNCTPNFSYLHDKLNKYCGVCGQKLWEDEDE